MAGSQKNKHRLAVIKPPLPGTRATLTSESWGPIFFTGSEEVPNLLCGRCERILVSGTRRERIGDWVLKCAYCGAFNDTAWPPDLPAEEPLKSNGSNPTD
jgi:hypothetical protein